MRAADSRRYSPAAERNGPPILGALQRLLPPRGLMIEIASGTGQHAACLSQGLPGWRWYPTDADVAALASISDWCAGLANVHRALHLDVTAGTWPSELPSAADGMFCANMIHVAPWSCTAALLQGAARHLTPDGLLVTYGPYLEDDVPTTSSNLAFDDDLRARDPTWGLRRVQAVAHEAAAVGLTLLERVAMPANNLLLVWGRPTRARAADGLG
ncbi:MAG: DUF938 domain-containing protein [Piscinibacter sp.]|nr:DUF938 domain-containing protein [Piscinibacter sp.]